ncbi:MAG: hypothetical protein PHT24_07975, partial [Endomicrobiaceae bacterium]|nr:hypothetical protein [Endomicrobiaceae bacterium]
KEVMNFLETESRKGNKQKRKNRWAWWSDEFHGHDFPPWLKDIIMRVNLHKNLDPLSPYGFCVIYKIYVERYTETEAIAFVNPDKYGDYLYDYLKQKRFTRRKKKR